MKLLSIIAVLVIAVIATPIIAESMGSFLTIKKAKVEVEPEVEVDKAKIKADAAIPTDGSGGAFGYGILTNGDSIMVTTTHAGVLDSEDQANANDPVWHNHYVRLGLPDDSYDPCDGNPYVKDITWESPGTVEVDDKHAEMEDLIAMFIGTHSITEDPLYMAPGTNVTGVVSFQLEPVLKSNADTFDGIQPDELKAVCVTNIQPAEEVKVKIED